MISFPLLNVFFSYAWLQLMDFCYNVLSINLAVWWWSPIFQSIMCHEGKIASNYSREKSGRRPSNTFWETIHHFQSCWAKSVKNTFCGWKKTRIDFAISAINPRPERACLAWFSNNFHAFAAVELWEMMMDEFKSKVNSCIFVSWADCFLLWVTCSPFRANWQAQFILQGLECQFVCEVSWLPSREKTSLKVVHVRQYVRQTITNYSNGRHVFSSYAHSSNIDIYSLYFKEDWQFEMQESTNMVAWLLTSCRLP